MTRRRKYENVTSFIDRHGLQRWRWRKTGFKPHSFRAPYGTAEFEQEYLDCKKQVERASAACPSSD